MSNLFCGTLESCTQNSNHNDDHNLGIKLYKINLLEFQESVSRLIDCLSPSERYRANRYHFIKDKNRFIICRTLLKFLLSEYTGVPIASIFLDIDSNKKPYLPAQPSVFFNVSHAGNYAIIAIGNYELGVDVEYIDVHFDFNDILYSVFSDKEINFILNSNNSRYEFYKFWTRKEAIVKATGKGIDEEYLKIPVTDGLHTVSSSLVCDFENINVFNFDLNTDYIGALAFAESSINFNKITFYPVPSVEDLISLNIIR